VLGEVNSEDDLISWENAAISIERKDLIDLVMRGGLLCEGTERELIRLQNGQICQDHEKLQLK